MWSAGTYASDSGDSDQESYVAWLADGSTTEQSQVSLPSQVLAGAYNEEEEEEEEGDSDATMIVHEDIPHSEKVNVEQVTPRANKVTGMTAEQGAPAHAQHSERLKGSLGTAILVGGGSVLWGMYYINGKASKGQQAAGKNNIRLPKRRQDPYGR